MQDANWSIHSLCPVTSRASGVSDGLGLAWTACQSGKVGASLLFSRLAGEVSLSYKARAVI